MPQPAIMEADVLSPSGTKTTIALADDGSSGDPTSGDGVYSSATLAPSVAGFFTVAIHGAPTGAPSTQRSLETGFDVIVEPSLAIISLESAPTVTNIGRLSELRATIANHGAAPADSAQVAFVDATAGETLGIARVSVPARDSAVALVQWVPAVSGEYPVVVSVRVLGREELLVADNADTLVIPVAGALPVLSTEPTAGTSPKELSWILCKRLTA